MNRKQFEQRVLTGAGPDLRSSDALKVALFDAAQSKEIFREQDVREALAYAGANSESLLTSPDRDDSEGTVRKERGAEAHFISRELMKALAPEITALRREGFGTSDPPYPPAENSVAAKDVAIVQAAAWIEKASNADLERWRTSRASKTDLSEQIERMVKESGYEGYSLHTSPYLPYFGPPDMDFQKSAPTAPGTFLAKFARRITEWSKRTRIQPSPLTMHVLTGVLPLISRVRFTENERHFELPSGDQTHMRSVTLTINTADLSFDELREIYNDVKQFLGGKGQRAPTFEDVEFWELVESMGGPPDKGIRKFWKAVRDRWNSDHPDTEPRKSWEGFQDRHERLARRLGAVTDSLSPNSRR